MGILSIVAGLIILLWTGMSVRIYVIFAGVIAIIGGILELLELGERHDLTIAKPVILIILGLLMVLMPFIMAEIGAIVFAIFFILFGIIILFGFGNAEKNQLMGSRIVGAIMIVIGVLIIIFPKQTVEIMEIIFGVALIIIGLACVINAVQTRKVLGL